MMMLNHISFKTGEFQAQLLRSLGKTYFQGADIGECFATANKIIDGDMNSWHSEWFATANRLKATADFCIRDGYHVSATQAYLRACEYYRQSMWFMRDDLKNTRILSLADTVQQTFLLAIKGLSYTVTPMTIPIDHGTCYGYFCQTRFKPKATIIMMGGYDSMVEELYFSILPFLQRGYNALIFDGPGQGQTLIRKGLYMRYDWENIIPPIIDYLFEQRRLEYHKIVLFGRSLGGFLAPRGASNEPRLAALICDPGQYNLYESVQHLLPRDVLTMFENDQLDAVNHWFEENVFTDPHKKYFFRWRMASHGVSTPAQWLQDIKSYHLVDLAKHITARTLVCYATNEDKATGQAQQLYKALSCPKSLLEFSDTEGAGDHCESAAQSLFAQRAGDWLDQQFG